MKVIAFVLLLSFSLFGETWYNDVVKNGSFDDSLNTWNFYKAEDSVATVNLDTNNVITGKNCAHVNVLKSYKDYPSGKIMLNTPAPIKNGTKYRVSFNIRASKDITGNGIWWCIYEDANDPLAFYNGLYGQVLLEKDSTFHFEQEFVADVDDDSASLSIDFAAIPVDSVEIWIDDVEFKEQKVNKIVGQWDFNDSTDIAKATIGDDLDVFGNAIVVDGITEDDGAVLLGNGDYFKTASNMIPDHEYVNNYTYRIDFKVDDITGYNSLLQTKPENNIDGRMFVNNGTVGKGDYSAFVIKKGRWNRLIMTVKEDSSGDDLIIKAYVNGAFAVQIFSWTVDGGYAVRDSILFLRDNDGEEKPTAVSQIVLYNYALSEDEVAELGGYKDKIEPEKMSFMVAPHALGTTTVSMTADTAKSEHGGIKYNFECINSPEHSSRWQDSQVYVDSTLEMGKEYIFTVKAKNGDKVETAVSDSIKVITDYVSDVVYAEVDGKCVMEAEKASIKANGDFSEAGWSGVPYQQQMRWEADTVGGGYAGSGYMTTKEGIAPNAEWENGTELAWEVEITTAGEYYIAVRRNSNGDGSSDSGKPGVDGEEKSGSTFWGDVSEFTWARCAESLGTLSVGTHTIQIRRREDGFMVDRAMIATSLDFLPAEGSTEIGPNETLKPKDELPLPEDGTELLVNNYFDDGLDNWSFHSNGSTSYELDESGVLEGKNSAHVRVDSLYEPYDSGSWRIQVHQKNIKGGVKAGKKYFVQFQVKASKEITAGADGVGFTYAVIQQHDDWDPLQGCKKVISIPADSAITVTDTMECAVTDSLVYFSFDLGNLNVDSVDIWIDAVHLMELGITDGIEIAENNLPNSYQLSQNYPNPFNPTTTINFTIPVAGKTLLTVYNVLGQKVATLFNGDLSAGLYNYKFDATHLSSGIYFYELRSKNYTKIMKMMLIK